MRVVGVRQQIDIEAKWHVADSRDLVLRRPPSVEKTRGGKLELLKSVETQTLHEPSFNLTDEETVEKSEKFPHRPVRECVFLHFLPGQQTWPMSTDGLTLLPMSITMSVPSV